LKQICIVVIAYKRLIYRNHFSISLYRRAAVNTILISS